MVRTVRGISLGKTEMTSFKTTQLHAIQPTPRFPKTTVQAARNADAHLSIHIKSIIPGSRRSYPIADTPVSLPALLHLDYPSRDIQRFYCVGPQIFFRSLSSFFPHRRLSLVVAQAAISELREPMNMLTAMALGPLTSLCSRGPASSASSGLLPGSSTANTMPVMRVLMN